MISVYVKARYLILILLAAFIGVLTGIMAFALHYSIDAAKKFFLFGLNGCTLPGSPSEIEVVKTHFYIGGVPIFLIPSLGGLLCGILAYFAASETMGGGTSEAIKAFHFLRNKIRARVPFVKTIVTAFTIGSGGSGGREGPIMQIGAGLGSIVGNLFKISEKDKGILLICGIAGGMGSVFLSPIGGAIFGIEVLYKRDYEVEAFVPAVVASIIAYSVFHLILSYFSGIPFGNLRMFSTVNTHISSPVELLAYLVLGIASGVVSLIYIFSYKKIHKFFKKLPVHPILKPAIGGLIVGIIGWQFTYILGTGYGFAEMAIKGMLPALLLFIIAFAKILATTITIGSGGSGGLFAPAVVIGCMFGGAIGYLFHNIFPTVITNPTGYMLVGMAALLAGAFKTPLAAVIMVFEMTGSYNLLPALAIASVASYVVTGRHSICDLQPMNRLESPVHRGELSVDILKNIKVDEAMTPANQLITVSPHTLILDVLHLIEKTGHIGFPVIENGKLVGIVTFEDIEKVPFEKRNKTKVSDVMSRQLIVTYPDESLEDALLKLANYNIGRLPVVNRKNEAELIGLITRSAIIRAHAKATRIFP